MKFALAYYLLLIYSTIILKPVIPIAKDILLHCFAEAYHIATVHAEYGNNHLQQDVANTNDDNNANSKSTLKAEDVVTIHIPVTVENFDAQIINLKNQYPILPHSSLYKTIVGKIDPPPKFSN